MKKVRINFFIKFFLIFKIESICAFKKYINNALTVEVWIRLIKIKKDF